MKKSLLFLLAALTFTPVAWGQRTFIINDSNIDLLNSIITEINKGNPEYIDATISIDFIEDLNPTITQAIGTKTHPFRGIFQGNHSRITFNPEDKTLQYSGLFGYTSGAEIHNINLTTNSASEYTSISSSDQDTGYAGCIVGYAENTLIKGCLVSEIKGFGFRHFSTNSNLYQNYICGGADNKTILKNNYTRYKNEYNVTSDYFGKNTYNGETNSMPKQWVDIKEHMIIDIAQGYNQQSIILYQPNSILEITNNGISWLINATIFSFCKVKELILHSATTLTGSISTQKLILYDGCYPKNLNITDCKEIIYHRTFDNFAERLENNLPGNGGWQTIMLPFDAKLYVDDTPLEPVLEGKGGKYWLREYHPEESSDNEVCFKSMKTSEYNGYIKKNTPYIIALPGNGYGSNSLAEKGNRITFRSINQEEIDITSSTYSTGNLNDNKYIFTGNFERTFEKQQDRIYILNNPSEENINTSGDTKLGTEFKLKDFSSNTGYPNFTTSFRASLKTPNTTQNTSGRIRIVDRPSSPTELVLSFDNEEDMIYTNNGNIYIQSSTEKELNIISAISGCIIRKISLQADQPKTIEGLDRGIYIIGNKKVVL